MRLVRMQCLELKISVFCLRNKQKVTSRTFFWNMAPSQSGGLRFVHEESKSLVSIAATSPFLTISAAAKTFRVRKRLEKKGIPFVRSVLECALRLRLAM
jgi:hypothetical protein